VGTVGGEDMLFDEESQNLFPSFIVWDEPLGGPCWKKLKRAKRSSQKASFENPKRKSAGPMGPLLQKEKNYLGLL